MKSTKTNSRIPTLCLSATAILFLTSWSPPTGENITMASGNLSIGPSNDTVGDGSAFQKGSGIVAGKFNNLHTGGEYSGIIGRNNDTKMQHSLVIGAYNNVTQSSTSAADRTSMSGIFGQSNQINGPTRNTLVAGWGNTVTGSSCLVAGYNNTVGAVSQISSSIALGSLNTVSASPGYAVGYGNETNAYRAAAFGTGLISSESTATALGRFNDTMETGDVLVVGNGSNADNRNTALRITGDSTILNGKVIINTPQGDISMGIYQ